MSFRSNMHSGWDKKFREESRAQMLAAPLLRNWPLRSVVPFRWDRGEARAPDLPKNNSNRMLR